MKKYLYGKKQYLLPIAEGTTSPRFSDIAHYARLENKKIRDDEVTKSFFLDRNSVTLEINNTKISGISLADDVKISIPVRHCFCLCLSGKAYDKGLFEKFEADICLEIDVEKLMTAINFALTHVLPGSHAIAKQVTYFDPYCFAPSLDPDDLVFCKPLSFADENEYRVAIFYPPYKKAFKSKEGRTIPIQNPNDPWHITITHDEASFVKDFVVGWRYAAESAG